LEAERLAIAKGILPRAAEEIPLHFGSREKIHFMPPQEFLQVASKTDLHRPAVEHYMRLVKRGEPITDKSILGVSNSIPSLTLDELGINRRVRGHEGRHRAQALLELGVPEMPVALNDPGIRWASQVPGDKNFVPDEKWPKFIFPQKKALDISKKIAFPPRPSLEEISR
jgi:hypothetical protein